MEHPKFIEFEGRKYRLSSGNYYRAEDWGKATCNLHRAIWESHNGRKVPARHAVHHIDGDVFNNDISNLELVPISEHARYHLKKRIADGTWDYRKSLEKAQEGAKTWHGSPEGLAWHSKNGREAWKNRKLYTVACQICGKEFETFLPDKATFCGINCQSTARRRSGKDNIQRPCVICGANFTTSKYSKTKTCSKNCANISMLKNRRRL